MSLTVKGCKNRGFVFSDLPDATTHLGVQLHNVVVSDIASSTPGATPTCLWARGEGLLIKNSRFSGCKDDGIWANGTNLTIENNWFDGVGVGSANHPDCIQLTGASDDFRLRGNTCNQTLPGPKQCFFVHTGNPTSSSHGEITDNVCFMPTYDGVNGGKGIYNNHPNVLIARNFITGGEHGIWHLASNGTVIANVVTAPRNAGIYINQLYAANVINNTVVGDHTTDYCLISAGNAKFINNVLSGCVRSYASFVGQNYWESNLTWGNTFNTPQFSSAVDNPVINALHNVNPGFSGSELYDANAWRISTTTAGADVSSYGAPAMLDFHKDPRSSGTELGALTP